MAYNSSPSLTPHSVCLRLLRVHVLNEGLIVLLLFTNKEHCSEQFACFLSQDIPTTVGGGERRNCSTSHQLSTLKSTAALILVSVIVSVLSPEICANVWLHRRHFDMPQQETRVY